MITTLEHDSLTYGGVVSDKATGSLFRNIARGVNLPNEVSIRHQDYVDSKTKKSGRRSVVRLDRYVELTDGTIAPVSGMFIVMVPKDANITATDINSVTSLGANIHGTHGEAGYTDLHEAVFVNGEQ